ncbi:hypothetical protein ACWATR_04715 [Nostoc sp. UIC 10890]
MLLVRAYSFVPLLIEITVVMAIAYFYFNAELNHFLPKHSHFVEDKASMDFLELGFTKSAIAKW